MTTACNKPPIPKNKPKTTVPNKRIEASALSLSPGTKDDDEPMYYEIDGCDTAVGEGSECGGRTSEASPPQPTLNPIINEHMKDDISPKTEKQKDISTNRSSEVLYSKVNKTKDSKEKDVESPKSVSIAGCDDHTNTVATAKRTTPKISLPRNSLLELQKVNASDCSPVKQQIHYFESLDTTPRSASASPDTLSTDDHNPGGNTTGRRRCLSADTESIVIENSLYDTNKVSMCAITDENIDCLPEYCVRDQTVFRQTSTELDSETKHGPGKEGNNVERLSTQRTPMVGSSDSEDSLYAECLEDQSTRLIDNHCDDIHSDNDDGIPPYATSKKRDISNIFQNTDVTRDSPMNETAQHRNPSGRSRYMEDTDSLYAECRDGSEGEGVAEAIFDHKETPVVIYKKTDTHVVNDAKPERHVSHKKSKSLPSWNKSQQPVDPLYAECEGDHKETSRNVDSEHNERDQTGSGCEIQDSIPPYATSRARQNLVRQTSLPRALTRNTTNSLYAQCGGGAVSAVCPAGEHSVDEQCPSTCHEGVIPPYATSRPKSNAHKIDSDDENVYEDVDNERNPVSLSYDDPLLTGIKIDRHIYNYICTFEPDKVAHIKPVVETNTKNDRDIFVNGTASEENFEEFIAYYKDMKHKLYVEGVKMDSLTNVNILHDHLQSAFKCMCCRPNSQDFEILCLKDDVHRIKEALRSNGDEVEFIYEMAKSTEIASVIQEEAKDMFQSVGFVVGDMKVFFHVSDITSLKVAAIVNAANRNLNHGGGVAKAIADAAGPKFAKLCKDYVRANGLISVTGVAVTDPGSLLCRAVLHAVGPRCKKRQEEECLKQLEVTFRNIFREAEKGCMETVAVPPVSSGIFGVPHDKVASVLTKVLTTLPKMDQLKAIHVVDIKTDILEAITARLYRKSKNSSSSVKKMSDETVTQSLQAIQGDSSKTASAPYKKGIGYKLKALFTKNH